MRKNIVILDDELDIGYLLKSNIGTEIYDVFCFQDLKSGIQETEKLNPLFLFIDINFPDGNGLDYVPYLKSTLPECIIIVISAYDEESLIQRALSSGAQDFLPKPFTRDMVLGRISKFSMQGSLS